MEENEIISKLIEDLLKLPQETEWVEFKQNNFNPDKIGEYISALSNSACLHKKDYGFLVFGIENSTHNVVGTLFKPKEFKIGNEELENWLHKFLEPSTDFRVFETNHNGKQVVIFQIDPTYNTPIKFKNVAYIRIGSYKRKLIDFPGKERKIWNVIHVSNKNENLIRDEWINNRQNEAYSHRNKNLGFIEYIVTLENTNEKFELGELRNAVVKAYALKNKRESNIYNLIFNRQENLLIPIDEGIGSELNYNDEKWYKFYIYLAIKNDGTLYLHNSFFEDTEESNEKYVSEFQSIMRISDTLIFLSNFYLNLGIPINNKLNIRIKHGNLKGRVILFDIGESKIFYGHHDFRTNANEVKYNSLFSLEKIHKGNLSNIVKDIVKGLFELFDFFKEEDSIISKYVDIYADKWEIR